MASSLIGGFLKAGAVSKSRMSVAEPFTPIREKHASSGIFATADNKEVVARSEVIWLAVKPDILPLVLSEVAQIVGSSKLIVSIAAGVSISTMEAHLPKGARVIRVMPNLPCLVGECAAGFCRGSSATTADANVVRKLLNTVGMAEEVCQQTQFDSTKLSYDIWMACRCLRSRWTP